MIKIILAIWMLLTGGYAKAAVLLVTLTACAAPQVEQAVPFVQQAPTEQDKEQERQVIHDTLQLLVDDLA